MTELAFNDIAIQSSHAFRGIMQAMARPGVPVRFESALEAPPPLYAASAAVALTLCDFQTPIWVSPVLTNEKVRHYLRFHTGAPINEEVADAHFAFLSADEEPPPLTLFAQGTHEYPDRSATLVIQAQGFHGRSVVLEGPGINLAIPFGVDGLSRSFWAAMAENHARFPVGVDVIFAAPGSLVALPRSTALAIQETA